MLPLHTVNAARYLKYQIIPGDPRQNITATSMGWEVRTLLMADMRM